MGILDSVVSALNSGGAPGAPASGSSVANELIAMLQGQGGANGLTGLLQAFESGGLGHLFQSWVGNGQNLPVSPDQLRSVLGNSGLLERLSQATGLQPADVAQHLSTLLPQIVDHLTPNGQLHPGDVGSALEGLAQRFLRG
ncbi:MAG TPA: YidB family protein [Steroidobacteraceae bacterium]|nr:YidB family protein [Steroidobacteraceae bacterium]